MFARLEYCLYLCIAIQRNSTGKVDLLIHTPKGAGLKDSKRSTLKSLGIGLGRLAIVNNARY